MLNIFRMKASVIFVVSILITLLSVIASINKSEAVTDNGNVFNLTGSYSYTLKSERAGSAVFYNSTGYINFSDCSTEGKTVITAGRDGQIMVSLDKPKVEAKKGEVITTYEHVNTPEMQSEAIKEEGKAWVPIDRYVGVSPSTVFLYLPTLGLPEHLRPKQMRGIACSFKYMNYMLKKSSEKYNNEDRYEYNRPRINSDLKKNNEYYVDKLKLSKSIADSFKKSSFVDYNEYLPFKTCFITMSMLEKSTIIKMYCGINERSKREALVATFTPVPIKSIAPVKVISEEQEMTRLIASKASDEKKLALINRTSL